ncbi:conserved protein of unknown function [Methylococcus capsulatus]|uniref:Uncharacterized protein n=1 Tax=Methylococcus capsulatus TaxID=414 RepID=A0AA35XXB8_METCP|nr:hypothetical protein [Methylococcus capsulatus]CAI8742920.1 conserved protein of unknown function [Methylococcus capsulatus]
MAFFLLGHTNRIDAATLSGGTWNSLYPLTNLQDAALARVARSVGTTSGASTIVIDCGAAKDIRTLGLVNHNIRSTGTVRLEGSNAVGFSPLVADSGAVTVYADTVAANPTFTLDLGAVYLARYWRITISDSGNPAGYIRLGRVFLGDGWQPTETNFSWGKILGIENPSVVSVLPSGRRVVDVRPPSRNQKYQIKDLTKSDALREVFQIAWTHGLDKEVLLFEDPADNTYADVNNFLATIRQLPAIEYPYLDAYSAAFEFSEIIA